jgi:hypothetical protein
MDYVGMTDDRVWQLEEHPELQQDAYAEIWAEMMRARNRLEEIRMAHYLIYYPGHREASPELDDEEIENRRQGLIDMGYAVTQEVYE